MADIKNCYTLYQTRKWNCLSKQHSTINISKFRSRRKSPDISPYF